MVMGLGIPRVLNSVSQTLPRALNVQLVNYLKKWRRFHPTAKSTGIITLSPGVQYITTTFLRKMVTVNKMRRHLLSVFNPVFRHLFSYLFLLFFVSFPSRFFLRVEGISSNVHFLLTSWAIIASSCQKRKSGEKTTGKMEKEKDEKKGDRGKQKKETKREVAVT